MVQPAQGNAGPIVLLTCGSAGRILVSAHGSDAYYKAQAELASALTPVQPALMSTAASSCTGRHSGTARLRITTTSDSGLYFRIVASGCGFVTPTTPVFVWYADNFNGTNGDHCRPPACQGHTLTERSTAPAEE
jgi:hypothetical protein